MFGYFTGSNQSSGRDQQRSSTSSSPHTRSSSSSVSSRSSGSLSKCSHYERQCQVKAPCCGKFFPCRLCHDSALPEDWETAPPRPGQCNQKMNRHAVQEIQCNACGTVQSVSNHCVNSSCAIQFGHYFCPTCRLYATPSAKGIYHCEGCGICRVGQGLDVDFFHCETCQGCFTLDSKDEHICFKGSLSRDCPICLEYMFDSREMCSVGRNCGHAMHSSCYKQFVRQGYRDCPACFKPLF